MAKNGELESQMGSLIILGRIVDIFRIPINFCENFSYPQITSCCI